MILKSTLVAAAGSLAMLLAATSTANAAGFAPSAKSVTGPDTGSLITRVHSLGEAEDELARIGYYDIHVERASLPYSFIACKRGARYHRISDNFLRKHDANGHDSDLRCVRRVGRD